MHISLLRRPLLALLPLLFVCAFASEAHAGPITIGISQNYAGFPKYLDNANFKALNISTVRVIVPWDIAKRQGGKADEFTDFLRAANNAGKRVFVVFGLSENDEAGVYSVTPTPNRYLDAFQTFRSRWPGVTLFGAWNEPNTFEYPTQNGDRYPLTPSGNAFVSSAPADSAHPNDPSCPAGSTLSCGPLLVATYYYMAKVSCQDCTIVAGEFNSSINDYKYWSAYANALQSLGFAHPDVASFHGYHDAKRTQDEDNFCSTANPGGCTALNFNNWATGHGWGAGTARWNTEVGVYRTSTDADQACRYKRLMYFNDRAGVSRLYYYNFVNGGDPASDRGLVNGDLSRRDIFGLVDQRVVPASPPSC